jgi:hypothetical protein
MDSTRPRRVPVALDVIPFASPDGSLAWVECLDCREPLGLHQPDDHCPDRLLGICEACRRWFLLLMSPEESLATMVILPEAEWFRAVSEGEGPPVE